MRAFRNQFAHCLIKEGGKAGQLPQAFRLLRQLILADGLQLFLPAQAKRLLGELLRGWHLWQRQFRAVRQFPEKGRSTKGLPGRDFKDLLRIADA